MVLGLQEAPPFTLPRHGPRFREALTDCALAPALGGSEVVRFPCVFLLFPGGRRASGYRWSGRCGAHPSGDRQVCGAPSFGSGQDAP